MGPLLSKGSVFAQVNAAISIETLFFWCEEVCREDSTTQYASSVKTATEPACASENDRSASYTTRGL